MVPEVLVSRRRQRPGYRFSACDFEYHQLIAVQSGQLACRLEGRTRRLGAGAVVVLTKGSTFDLWCDQGGYRGIGIGLTAWEEAPAEATNLAADAAMQQLLGMIELELQRAEPGSAGVVRHLALAFCGLLEAKLRDRRLEHGPEDVAYWSQRVRQAIDNHLGSDIPLSMVLDDLGLCYRQLTRHVLEAMGLAPKQYQMLRRIEEGQRLLAETGLSVASIARELGFPSPQHFATQFKRITGQTPSDHRFATTHAL
jgi:AraC-like DNA-binding protein